MDLSKLASRIYGLCAGFSGGDPNLAALITDRVLKKMPPSASVSNHGLLCEAAKHLVLELSRLPGPPDDHSQTQYGDWPFHGRLIIALQALNGLHKDQRLLLLLRDQWGLGVGDLALCWHVPEEEILARVKAAQKQWRYQLDLILSRKRMRYEL